MRHRQWIIPMLAVLLPRLTAADTRMLFDREPNDQPGNAVEVPAPDKRQPIKIVGELSKQDQDAYYWHIDDEQAGNLWTIRINGLTGALTQLDILDLTAAVEASPRGIRGIELDQRPSKLLTLKSPDGSRPAVAQDLLLAPGDYVLGVSHSGGSGSYSIEISQSGSDTVRIPEPANSSSSPHVLRVDRALTVQAESQTWFGFSLTGEQAEQNWTVSAQSPLGVATDVQLQNSAGEQFLEITGDGGFAAQRSALQLPAGDYRLLSTLTQPTVQILMVYPGGAVAENHEIEPNDDAEQATRLVVGQAIKGQFESSDTDWLTFNIDESDQSGLWDITVQPVQGADVELCLYRTELTIKHCRRGPKGAATTLHRLGLSAGNYFLRLQSRGELGAYQLGWESMGDYTVGVEAEPNDSADFPASLSEKGFAKGHFNGRETDFWRFQVPAQAQLWRAQLQGDSIDSLAIHDGSGKRLQFNRAKGSNRVRLDNLVLSPGEHFLAVKGDDSDYLIRLLPLGPYDPTVEIEPNNDYQHAVLLPFDEAREGTLSDTDDIDVYAFSLQGQQRVGIKIVPPADGSISAQLGLGDRTEKLSEIRAGQEVGQPLQWTLNLQPGDYSVALKPRQISDADYTITMQRLPLYTDATDNEPNDARDHASLVPESGVIAGHVGTTVAAVDWYRLPVLIEDSQLRLAKQQGVRAQLYAGDDTRKDILQTDAEGEHDEASLTANTIYYLKVSGSGSYEYDLSGSQSVELAEPGQSASHTKVAQDTAETSPLDMAVEFQQALEVQAYSPWQQQLDGQLKLTNSGSEPLNFSLVTAASDLRWNTALDNSTRQLAAGQDTTISLQLTIPPDAYTGQAVRIEISAVSDNRQVGHTTAEVLPRADAFPVAPQYHWSIPSELRGGLNVAASYLGARPVSSPGIDDAKLDKVLALMDGQAIYGGWAGYSMQTANRKPADYARPTIELAGDQPVSIAGFLLNPTSEQSPNRYLKDFEIAVSEDGIVFNTVLQEQLQPVAQEQSFVLEAPVSARFVRLIPKTAAFGDAARLGSIVLGEFKVIATPGPVAGLADISDVAASDLGGHLVWSEPWLSGNAKNRTLGVAGDAPARVRVSPDSPAVVVLGFHHQRAARLTGAEFLQSPRSKPEQQAGGVVISRSVNTPLGPWEVVDEWSLSGPQQAISFDTLIWARYLKFEFTGQSDNKTLYLPDQIKALEMPASKEYSSILGEWGHYSSAGPLEAAQTPEWIGPLTRPDNDSRASAFSLVSGESQAGAALLDEYDGWYRMDLAAGQNSIELVLTGQPTVQAVAELQDAAGNMVTLYPGRMLPGAHHWQAFVEPGQSYWLRIYEPPRSVIFSWDTSGSVAWYTPAVVNAVSHFATHIKPGREEVNLVPFGIQSPLLNNWQGNPYPVRKMLNAWPHDSSSSDAEVALIVASRALQNRPGKKAVILVTDAASPTKQATWSALDKARPQIFGMHLSSSGAAQQYAEQDLMQDWTRVNNGYYEYITSLGSLQRAFDRATVRLRQPVTFAVQADIHSVADPGPASISVISSDEQNTAVARGAVELILDASGSMLKRMGGQRRIQIAKQAIADTVQTVLPEGISLALRVYGHKEAGSCRTDLEQKLAPLNKQQLLRKLDNINAINLAKTPIADSLAKVEQDLKNAEGQRWVILLTDGEETCEGDPAAVLEQLAEKGIEVRLNIVGFAINDEQAKSEFERWAQLGGGAYFDASNAEALAQALDQALQIPFKVFDSAGELAGQGVLDGAAVEVPPGEYLVRLETSPPQTFARMVLVPGEQRELQAGQ